MTERAASIRNDAAPSALAVSATRTPEGSLIFAVRYSYEGRIPSQRTRTEMAKAMLREATARLEDGNPVDVGFSENSHRCVRTDRMEV